MSQAGVDRTSSGTGVVETLTGNSGGAVPPTAGNITVVGSGTITVAGNPGTSTLTISSTGSSFTWQAIGGSQTLAVNNGYFCTTGGALSLALPAVSAVGDTIEVTLDGSTSWTITQPNAATRIRIGSSQTTLGVGGTLASSAVGDAIRLVCQTANARWQVTPGWIGTITIV